MKLDDHEHDAIYAPLLDHLIELRKRLIWCLIAFMIAFMFCFLIKEYILDLLLVPYQWAMKLSGGDPDKIRLQSTQVLETFLTKMKLSAFGAIVLVFPVIAFQLYRFIAPGLYRQERRAFLPYLFFAPILFLIGGAFVYMVIIPLLLWFSLTQQLTSNTQIQIEFIARISDYLSFMISLILSFGLVFQLPVITSLLVKVGILRAHTLISLRRWAVIAAFIFAAMVTPSDLFSMFGLALPTILLYEIAIFLAHRIEQKTKNKK